MSEVHAEYCSWQSLLQLISRLGSVPQGMMPDSCACAVQEQHSVTPKSTIIVLLIDRLICLPLVDRSQERILPAFCAMTSLPHGLVMESVMLPDAKFVSTNAV